MFSQLVIVRTLFWVAALAACAQFFLYILVPSFDGKFPFLLFLPLLLMPVYLVLGARKAGVGRSRTMLGIYSAFLSYLVGMLVALYTLLVVPIPAEHSATIALATNVAMGSYLALAFLFARLVSIRESSIAAFTLWSVLSFYWYFGFFWIERRVKCLSQHSVSS